MQMYEQDAMMTQHYVRCVGILYTHHPMYRSTSALAGLYTNEMLEIDQFVNCEVGSYV